MSRESDQEEHPLMRDDREFESEDVFPDEGTTWMMPRGMDRCPVCRTPGLFVSEEPNKCMCGAEFSGLSHTELVSVPERGEKDVLIQADEEDIRHKVFDFTDGRDLGGNPRRELAYWRVSGEPQKTGPGRMIMFSEDGIIVDYAGPICTTEEGRIYFKYLSPVSYHAPEEAPNQGYKYVDLGRFPW